MNPDNHNKQKFFETKKCFQIIISKNIIMNPEKQEGFRNQVMFSNYN